MTLVRVVQYDAASRCVFSRLKGSCHGMKHGSLIVCKSCQKELDFFAQQTSSLHSFQSLLALRCRRKLGHLDDCWRVFSLEWQNLSSVLGHHLPPLPSPGDPQCLGRLEVRDTRVTRLSTRNFRAVSYSRSIAVGAGEIREFDSFSDATLSSGYKSWPKVATIQIGSE